MTTPPSAPLMLSISGCRGIFGKSLSPETVARFAAALGVHVRENAPRGEKPLVIVGRDGRLGGQIVARAAVAGLAAAGCDVRDLGIAMTATIGVITDARRAHAGLVLTASHNPQEWNGLKPIVVSNRGEAGSSCASAPDKDTADAIIARFRSSGPLPLVGPEAVGTITQEINPGMDLPPEHDRLHVERVRAALRSVGSVEDRRAQGVKAVLDSVNASGRIAGRLLLGERLVHHLGASDSGIFPHAPEPIRENLTQLCRFVKEKGASVGFAQDPDADRLALVDDRGEYIGEEYTLVLAAEAVLGAMGERARGRILCTNLSTSRMIEDVAARHGARVLRTAVGEANVVSAMKREHAVLGGEGNGGVIWPEVTYIRDSLSAMGLVLALIARTGKTLSQLVADVPRYAIVKRKVDLPDVSVAARAVESVAKAFAKERLDRQDGVRVDFDSRRAWLHVRASNTEPIMRLIAEAPTEAGANEILEEASRAIG